MRPIAYLSWFAGAALVLAALTTGLTVAVDPYRMYGTPEIAGWTAVKPRAYNQTGIAKTYALERAEPRTLLLGNSRVEIGLDPASSRWPAELRPVFNAAEAGRDLFIAHRLLQHEIARQPPRLVVVGLDILDFLQKPDDGSDLDPRQGADELRLYVDRGGRPNPHRAVQIWQDRLATTLTIDAVLDSFATVLGQDTVGGETMTASGFNPLNEYRVFTARSGYHEIFAQKNAIYERQYARYARPDFADPQHYRNFRNLRRLIETAARNGSRLILYIHPYHSDYLEMLHRLGFWPSFEAWKRALARLVAEETAAANAGIELIDFSGYDRLTTEPVPPAGDRKSEMRWYWESGHYKRELGERMLARLFSGEDGFGQVLTEANVEDVLGSIRAARAQFLERTRSTADVAGSDPKRQ